MAVGWVGRGTSVTLPSLNLYVGRPKRRATIASQAKAHTGDGEEPWYEARGWEGPGFEAGADEPEAPQTDPATETREVGLSR